MSMLYVTHDLGVLAQIADRVGVMYAGRMVETAPTKALFAMPRHPYTRGLIASIPQIENANRSADIVLRGLLKRDELPAGCPFQPRCDFAESLCATEVQKLEIVGDGQAVACWRWRELPPPAVVQRDVSDANEAPSAVPLLQVENVSIGYGTGAGGWSIFRRSPALTVVEDISFTINAGHTFALVGESGSGKSTVARAVSGLLPASAGRIQFEGQTLPGTIAA